MKQMLKEAVKKTPLYTPLRNWANVRRDKRELVEWGRNNKPVPPPHIVKQLAIRTYAERFDLKILVETGTFYGDMIEAMKDTFNQIYSIELSQELYENARKRFIADSNVKILQGDSGIELGKIAATLDQPALFFLDGHYSAGTTAKGELDTPIFKELTHIFDNPLKGHVIIIDDARCFGTEPDYPSIEELCDFVMSKRPDITIEIENDSIRITP
jgi:hypothetical protein